MNKYIKVEDIMTHINTDNRGNCDYFIVDRIEELCNSDKTIDLADHDKQIRDEVIKQFAEWLEKMNYLHEVDIDYDWEEHPYETVIRLTAEDVIHQYFEQMKGEQNEYE